MIRNNQLLLQVKNIVETNVHDPQFNVNKLCFFIRISRASFYRKIMTQCHCSPKEYIEEIRLDIAKRKIIEEYSIIKEVAYEVGFTDPHYFSKRFKQRFMLTPSEYKRSFLS